MPLILTRKSKQGIIIDDRIRVTFLDKHIGCASYQLAIDAPKSIEIYREEIWVKINGKLWALDEKNRR